MSKPYECNVDTDCTADSEYCDVTERTCMTVPTETVSNTYTNVMIFVGIAVTALILIAAVRKALVRNVKTLSPQIVAVIVAAMLAIVGMVAYVGTRAVGANKARCATAPWACDDNTMTPLCNFSTDYQKQCVPAPKQGYKSTTVPNGMVCSPCIISDDDPTCIYASISACNAGTAIVPAAGGATGGGTPNVCNPGYVSSVGNNDCSVFICTKHPWASGRTAKDPSNNDAYVHRDNSNSSGWKYGTYTDKINYRLHENVCYKSEFDNNCGVYPKNPVAGEATQVYCTQEQ